MGWLTMGISRTRFSWPCALWLLASGVHAQSNNARAAAQALFDEARQAMAAGKHEEACPKLEESQRLDPGVGTQFNLAVCYEAIGRTASAWSLFLEVASAAHRAAERAREQAARERAATLEPKLSRLKIEVPEPTRTDGLSILRGAVEVGKGQWGVALPTDPGTYRVTASAPGKKSAQLSVTVPNDGDTYTITLGPLQDAPVTEVAGRDVAVDESWFETLGTQRVVALGVGAGAVLALGTGALFGLLALNDKSASEDDCKANLCGSAGLRDRNDARANGDRATVAFIAGGALAATAVVLFVTGAPAEREQPQSSALRVQPAVGPHQAALFVRGTL